MKRAPILFRPLVLLLAAIALVSAGCKKTEYRDLRTDPLARVLVDGAADAEQRALELIRGGADIERPLPDGTTVLMLAVHSGHAAVVRELLERGADPNRMNRPGHTALFWATTDSQLHLVKLLLERGADLNVKDGDRRRVHHWAAYRGQSELLDYLIERKVELRARDRRGFTLLDYALGRAPFEEEWTGPGGTPRIDFRPVAPDRSVVIDRVIAAGVDVNRPDRFGETPLIWAASQHQPGTVRTLIRAGAEVNARSNSRRTPLIEAAAAADDRTVALLIEKGADVLARDRDGYSALHFVQQLDAETPEKRRAAARVAKLLRNAGLTEP